MSRICRYCDGVMEAAWLMALMVTPLLFNVYSFRVYEPERIAFFSSCGYMAAAAWILSLLLGGGRVRLFSQPRGLLLGILRRPLALPVAFLAATSLLSTLYSISPLLSYGGGYLRMQGLHALYACMAIFLVLVFNLRRVEQIERILMVISLTSLPVALYAIAQHCGWDPYAWGVFAKRSSSTFGNPIFAGAFMGMSALVALSRAFVYMQGHDAAGQRSPDVLRACVYGGIVLVDVVGIACAASRGPLLALSASLLFFVFLFFAHFRQRRLLFAAVILGSAGVSVLAVLSMASGQVGGLFGNSFTGLSGQLFEFREGTGHTRLAIARGIIDMIMEQAAPLANGDLRPVGRLFFGWGFDTLQSVYGRFYSPDIFNENLEALVDRSHNQFFDSLVFTGFAGLVAVYGLYLSAAYYVLKALGMLHTRRNRYLYRGLVAGGGLLTGLAAVRFGHPEFAGVMVPAGLVGGLFVFVIMQGLRSSDCGARAVRPWQAVSLIGLLSGMVFHLVELLFGIPTAATLLYFWVYLALMLVLGRADALVHPEKTEGSGGCGESVSTAVQSGGKKSRKRRAALVQALPPKPNDFSRHRRSVAVGIVLALVYLMVLGFDFFFGVPLAGMGGAPDASAWVRDITLSVVLSALAMLGIGLLLAGVLAQRGAHERTQPVGLWGVFVCIGMSVATLSAVAAENLFPIRADMLFLRARSLADTGNFDEAFTVYDAVCHAAPDRDFYRLNWGRAYSDAVDGAEISQKEGLALLAIEQARHAYAINPRDPYNAINCGRFLEQAALAASDMNMRHSRFDEAERLYAQTLLLVPSRVDFMAQWARFRLTAGDTAGAVEKIEAARACNPMYAPLYGVVGEIRAAQAFALQDSVDRRARFDMAVAAFLMQISLLDARGVDSSAAARVTLGNVYAQFGRYSEARAVFISALGPGLCGQQWKICRAIAGISEVLGDGETRRIYLKKALGDAPEEEKGALRRALDSMDPS